MKSYVVHAKNKYPKHSVESDYENFVKVVDYENGTILCSVKKTGNGNLDFHPLDAEKPFDLAPLVKGSTFLRLDHNDRIVKDADHDTKKVYALKLADKFGYVPSVSEALNQKLISKADQIIEL